ncbi:MAG: ABC transporter substrate-binding protein [Synechocystis sp.]
MAHRILRLGKSFRRFWQRGVGVMLCLCLLISGCSPGGNPSQGGTAPAEIITIGTTQKPRTLDPADSYELAGLMVIYNLGETLYRYRLGTTELEPGLATALPTISEDGLTYTIPLRSGVTFHDGTPFNAEAMAFSLQRFMDNGGKPSFLLADTIATVKATGKEELTITLKSPFAAFPALLAYPGACAVSPQAYKIEAGSFEPNILVGTGPYQLESFSSNALRLKPFPDYWGDRPRNGGIDLQLFPSNPANLFNAFRTQAVDVAYQALVAQQVKTLQADAPQNQFQIFEAAGSVINFMALNQQRPPLDQLPLRQAIAALVDRQLLIDRILLGQGSPLYSMIPSSFKESQPVFEQNTPPRTERLTQAKQWLRSQGYTPENPLTLEIWHTSNSTNASIVATVMRALAKRDLEGLLEFQPNSIASASYYRNVGLGLYESSLSAWYPDFLDPDNYVYPFLDCAKGSTQSGCEEGGAQSQGSFYYSQTMNDLIRQERQETDPPQRQQVFAQIQTQLAADIPYIPLWQTKDYAFAQQGIEGVVVNPSQTFPFWTLHRS